MNLGTLERKLLTAYFKALPRVIVLPKDCIAIAEVGGRWVSRGFVNEETKKRYWRIVEVVKRLTEVDIDDKCYFLTHNMFPFLTPSDFEKLLFFDPNYRYPREIQEDIDKLKEMGLEYYLEEGKGKVFAEGLGLILRIYWKSEGQKYPYLVLIFNNKLFSVNIVGDEGVIERVVDRGFSWGGTIKYSEENETEIAPMIVVCIPKEGETPYSPEHVFLRILLHELGHFMGLDDHKLDNHKKDVKCVMCAEREITPYLTFCEECREKVLNTLSRTFPYAITH